MSELKQKLFRELCREAQSCTICPDLSERTAVLSELNGSIEARVFFLAEAPGRQGADRTRRPLIGDKSGEYFQKFIDSINLSREEIFISNAVMCNPRRESGANRKPTKKEISNCSDFLQRQIELLQPRVVVTLGTVALEALKAIENHHFTLKQNAARVLTWNKRLLIPLYHPSPQVLASHRREKAQLKDYQTVAEALKQNL
jgi:DNA polymerase